MPTPTTVVGGTAGPEQPVLAATTTRRVATTALPAERQSQLRTGDKVTVISSVAATTS